MNFVAIDFETSCGKNPCAIGLAIVENGIITKTIYHLIKPINPYFHPINISVHGIKPQDVKNAPTFIELWPEIYPYLDSALLAAHNAGFDMSVLRASCNNYDIKYPKAEYCCTVNISKKIWPKLGNHKLNTIADTLNINFNHHNAIDDAVVCAKVLIEACKITGASSVNELTNVINYSPKTL